MPSHRLIPLVVLLVFLTATCASPAHCQQSSQNEKEQEILRIQQSIEARDLDQARRQLREAAKQYPTDGGIDNLLGIVEAQQGNYIAAEKSFRQAIRRKPKFTGAYLNLGRLYQENAASDPGAPAKALGVYREVLEYDSGNAEANYQSARLFLTQGQFEESLAHVSRLSPESQQSAQTLSIECADYARLGNVQGTDQAARQLMAALDLSELDVQQALIGLIPGKRDDLIVALAESLQSRQQLPAALLQTQGSAYARLHRFAEARTALERSFSEGNASVGLLLELARIARQQKDYQGALGYLAHARDLDPGNATVHYYFGVVCVDLNLIAEAWDSFERAVKLQPENADFNYAMGAACSFRHDPAEAIPYFQKYLELKPDDPRGKLAMGATFFRAKDYQGAIPWLKQSAQIPETATKAHYYLGAIALNEGHLDEALPELQETLKDKPDYPDALAELGRYYLMQKDYRQAEDYLERALKIEPDHYKANFHLLTLYTRTKDARREAQAKRFEELEKLLTEKMQEFLRIVEARPLETP
jgi:tetratricopeptide (TPR) repeat protein